MKSVHTINGVIFSLLTMINILFKKYDMVAIDFTMLVGYFLYWITINLTEINERLKK